MLCLGIKQSMFSCYLLLLGVFDWSDFIRTDPLGPGMFMIFCIVMTFILINIFLTILMEVYAEVSVRPSEYLRGELFCSH